MILSMLCASSWSLVLVPTAKVHPVLASRDNYGYAAAVLQGPSNTVGEDVAGIGGYPVGRTCDTDAVALPTDFRRTDDVPSRGLNPGSTACCRVS